MEKIITAVKMKLKKINRTTLYRSAWLLTILPLAILNQNCGTGFTMNQTISDNTSGGTATPTPTPPPPTPTPPGYTPTPTPVPTATPPTHPPTGGIPMDLSYVNMSSTQYTRFKGFVDAAVGGNPGYGFSAADAAYMFKLTGTVGYCNLAVQMTERQVADAEAAIAGAHAPEVAGDSYLEVGPMISDLALTYSWCSAQTTTAQRGRWAAYAAQAISNVWNPSTASWGGRSFPWSGWSIDDPGNNYYYSFTEATMYWALAANDTALINRLTTQTLPALTNYFAAIPGGGSLEGTGYGTSHMRLFLIYKVWKDATASDLGNANSHMTDSIRFWVHATVPTRNFFAPIGDQARVSEPALFDYHRRLVLEARYLTNNQSAKDLASWWLNHISINPMTSGFNYRYDLFPAGTAGATPTEGLSYYASGVGRIFARTSWDTNAMWMSFAAGKFNQSHAHQDQGSFTLYAGTWLSATENIWSHSGIQQDTSVQNVIRFVRSGTVVRQREPSTSTMQIDTLSAAGVVDATGDLSPAYASGISWQRNVHFENRKLTVKDNYTVSPGTDAYFQANVPVQPTVNGQIITAGNLTMRVITPANAVITIVDHHAVDSDFNSGFRIDVKGVGTTGSFNVELSAP